MHVLIREVIGFIQFIKPDLHISCIINHKERYLEECTMLPDDSVKVRITAGILLLATSILTLNVFSQDPDFHIYLAFGQSNMEGNARPESKDVSDVDSRFQLLPAVNWPDGSRTKGVWTTAVPPLCRSSTGLCPADYFGRTLADSLPEQIKIGMVNVSVAGCAMDMFMKDNYQSYIQREADWMKNIANEYGGNPYGRLVEIARLAQEDGIIKGILLHQGETDAYKGGWEDKVKSVYENLIEDLDLDASKVPLLAGDLLSPSGAVQNLPNVIPNSYVISSQGLSGADQYHFTADSYRKFGKRYAETMLEILREQEETGSNEARSAISSRYGLNCRNGINSISFEVPERAFVSLKVFTLSGKEIVELAGREYIAGKHLLSIGRKSMSSEIVVLTMRSGSFVMARKIMVE
jgi:hypothetical protein